MTTAITFNWWNSADKNAEIPEDHQDSLRDEALTRISEMSAQGFTSGQLISGEYRNEEYSVENEVVTYTGYWEFK